MGTAGSFGTIGLRAGKAVDGRGIAGKSSSPGQAPRRRAAAAPRTSGPAQPGRSCGTRDRRTTGSCMTGRPPDYSRRGRAPVQAAARTALRGAGGQLADPDAPAPAAKRKKPDEKCCPGAHRRRCPAQPGLVDDGGKRRSAVSRRSETRCAPSPRSRRRRNASWPTTDGTRRCGQAQGPPRRG